MSPARTGPAVIAGLALVAAGLVSVPASANPAGTDLVISEVYGGGGNFGATLKNDFIELYNPTTAPISVAGKSVQYRSGTGTGTGFTDLTGSVPAKGYYLIQEAAGTGGTVDLPTPDATGNLAMSGTAGSVALVTGTGTVVPTSANTIDLVGYGAAALREGTAAPVLTNTTSASRNAAGTDTDNNSADFTAGAPDPENSSTVEPPPPPPPPPAPVARTIAEIQGTGTSSPLSGQTVITKGVVTAAYSTGGFNGIYIQTDGTGGATDPTPGASDGLFVFGDASGAATVAIGDFVEVTGTVSEFFGSTQVTPAAGGVVLINGQPHVGVTPQPTLPVSDCAYGSCPLDTAVLNAAREAHEGELYRPAGDVTVTNAFSLTNGSNGFMEIGLALDDEPLLAPTEVEDAQTGDIAGRTAYNRAHAITLDDASSANYTRDPASGTPMPWISRQYAVRVGAAATFRDNVIFEFRNNNWKIQPTSQITDTGTGTVTFEQTRAENSAPADVGGDLRLGSFNVLNYFNTTGADFDAGPGSCTYFFDRTGVDPVTNNNCTPDGPRGAAQREDFLRQQAKIVRAINLLDADIVSLEEIENSVKLGENRDDALDALVDALNTGAASNRWAFVPSPAAADLPPVEAQDVIRNAFIYDPSAVQLVGGSKVLVGSTAFINARQPLAQAFKARGGRDEDAFGVIVNHFKSKGSGVDDGTGQGNANPDRVAQAQALVTFADDFEAQRGISKTYLTGDFNAYTKEDPIQVLQAAGYTNLKSDTAGEKSYSFSGLSGSLDHIFADAAALPDVTGVDIWDINAGESLAYQYARFNYNVTDFFDGASPFAASDHNPELVGIDVPSTVAPPVASRVTLTASPATVRVKKGTSRLSVTVAAPRAVATGTVAAYLGEEKLAESRLSAGTATLTVGPFGTVGTKALVIRYSGDASTRSSQAATSITVVKQRPKLTVRAPRRIEVGDRRKLKTILVAEGYIVTGKVKIKIAKGGAKVVKTLKSGKTAWKMPRFEKPGSYRIKVVYRGDALTERRVKTIKIKVAKR